MALHGDAEQRKWNELHVCMPCGFVALLRYQYEGKIELPLVLLFCYFTTTQILNACLGPRETVKFCCTSMLSCLLNSRSLSAKQNQLFPSGADISYCLYQTSCAQSRIPVDRLLINIYGSCFVLINMFWIDAFLHRPSRTHVAHISLFLAFCHFSLLMNFFSPRWKAW